MTKPSIQELGEGRQMIDLGFRDTEGLVASYLIPEEEGSTLIETGPTSCRDLLLRGLDLAGVDRGSVRNVFVTHIHLDHAGGVGALLEDLPNAAFYAHHLGTPHLIDPTRLISSARRVWGAAADPLWGPIVPVTASRIHSLMGGERFPVRGGTLEVLNTPGHAKHHLAFFDTPTGAILTGDGAGVRLEGAGRPRPALPPPDLDLEELYRSVDAMRAKNPRAVWYSHFGPAPNGGEDLAIYPQICEEWRAVAWKAAQESLDPEFVGRRLREFEESRIAADDHARLAEDREDLVSGYTMAAMGLLRYFATKDHTGRGTG
jgi:glyoxylase-like metal-dependent hydrolase (beta-lactamase superfamily II)